MNHRTRNRAGLIAAVGLPLALLAARRRHRPARPPRSGDGRPSIVVAGAGFGGIAVLNALRGVAGDAADVLLIDQHNYHLFTPLLYQVATGSVDDQHIAHALRPFCVGIPADFLCTTVRGVNLVDQVVETDAGRIRYDYLVLALGSQTNYFGMQDVERHALGLKTIPAANRIRGQILDAVERAAIATDPAERRRLLTFAVVGAGATGVELVASLDDLLHNNLLPYYPNLRSEDPRIVLIEAMETILPGGPPRMRAVAARRLAELGIDIRLKTAVAGVRDGALVTRTGDVIEAGTVIWTAGIRPNPVAASLPVEKSRDGRIVVDEYLRIPSAPNVFAVGDNAFVPAAGSDAPLPANASVAVREGAAVGRNLVRLLNGESLEPFVFRSPGEMIALGRGRAAATIGPVTFDGLPAWLVWRIFHLSQIMGVRSRVGVTIDWIAALLSHRYITNTEA
ncbi:MAG: NAD(P)/FAD-dependent oxidoreductase [Sphaerobacter sp.]|nr:NAD(P)/FAD-dependent oxidoreductase [Sphaerobacter sp.]